VVAVILFVRKDKAAPVTQTVTEIPKTTPTTPTTPAKTTVTPSVTTNTIVTTPLKAPAAGTSDININPSDLNAAMGI
jgi:hypothetical protein